MGSVGAKQSNGSTRQESTGNSSNSKLSNQLESYRQLSQKNPNNRMYRDEVQNYEKYVKAEEKMDTSKKSFSGIQAAVALTNQKEGTEVEIKGNIFEGTYKLQTVRIPGLTPGLAWVQQGGNGHSFGNNISSVSSELGLINGGKVEEDKQKKIKIK